MIRLYVLAFLLGNLFNMALTLLIDLVTVRCHTLKSPLSMMSIILYCWLMSLSSTRFLSAFSWSFLFVSNSRLSDRMGFRRIKHSPSGNAFVSTLPRRPSLTQTCLRIQQQVATWKGYRSPGWSRVSVCACPCPPNPRQQRQEPAPQLERSALSAGGGREALFWKTQEKQYGICLYLKNTAVSFYVLLPETCSEKNKKQHRTGVPGTCHNMVTMSNLYSTWENGGHIRNRNF